MLTFWKAIKAKFAPPLSAAIEVVPEAPEVFNLTLNLPAVVVSQTKGVPNLKNVCVEATKEVIAIVAFAAAQSTKPAPTSCWSVALHGS